MSEIPTELVANMFELAGKARILKEWLDASAVGSPQLSDREVLTLQVVNDFAPVTENELARVFGISPGSINEMVKRLIDRELLDKTETRDGGDRRTKPLAITEQGIQTLATIKSGSARRYTYLLHDLTPEQLDALAPIIKLMNQSAVEHIKHLVFRRYA
jgi:DNA-binding MarR family transcriptional regulator